MANENAAQNQEPQNAHLTPEMASAVIAHAYTVNEKFRSKFDEDPKAVLEMIAEKSGSSLPDDLEIVVCRNTGNDWYLPLPCYEELEEKELSDEEMAQLSGGIAGVAGPIAGFVALFGTIAAVTVAVGTLVAGAVVGGVYATHRPDPEDIIEE